MCYTVRTLTGLGVGTSNFRCMTAITMEEWQETFRLYCEEPGTAARLSRGTGIDQSMISRLATGQRKPRAWHAKLIERVTGIPSPPLAKRERGLSSAEDRALKQARADVERLEKKIAEKDAEIAALQKILGRVRDAILTPT